MKARTVGPILLIMFGVVALFAPGSGAVGAGSTPPCTSATGVVLPCPTTTEAPTTVAPTTVAPTTAPVPTILTTTTEPATTTTPATTEDTTPTSGPIIVGVVVAPSTEAPATTTGGVQAVSGTAPAEQGVLARTGSHGTAPTTVFGLGLIVLGVTLLVLGRRRVRQG